MSEIGIDLIIIRVILFEKSVFRLNLVCQIPLPNLREPLQWCHTQTQAHAKCLANAVVLRRAAMDIVIAER